MLQTNLYDLNFQSNCSCEYSKLKQNVLFPEIPQGHTSSENTAAIAVGAAAAGSVLTLVATLIVLIICRKYVLNFF